MPSNLKIAPKHDAGHSVPFCPERPIQVRLQVMGAASVFVTFRTKKKPAAFAESTNVSAFGRRHPKRARCSGLLFKLDLAGNRDKGRRRRSALLAKRTCCQRRPDHGRAEPGTSDFMKDGTMTRG